MHCHALWSLYSTGWPLHTTPSHDGAPLFAKKNTVFFYCSAASHAEGQVHCRMGFDTQILRRWQRAGASPGSLAAPADSCRSISAGGTLSQYLRAIRLFLTFVNQCVGDLMRLTLHSSAAQS